MASMLAVTSAITAVAVPQLVAAPLLTALAQEAQPDVAAARPNVAMMSIDDIIAELDGISRDAEAKQEELNDLISQLDAKHAEIDELNGQLQQQRERAEAMKAQSDAEHERVNTLAVAKFRASNIDPISTIASSVNPQQAIDRSAYLNALNRASEAQALHSRQIARQAAEEFAAVASREALAEFQAQELEKQKAEVEAQQEEMTARTEEIRARVDGFSPDEQAEWIAKDGPVTEYSLEGVVGANEMGMTALAAAMTKLGSPYSWGAAGPDAFDCSGLVYWAYQQAGITLPRTSMAMMQSGIPVSREQLQPGDVVGYYAGASHVGMYAGNGLIVHASDYGIPVQVVPLDNAPIYGIRRYQ